MMLKPWLPGALLGLLVACTSGDNRRGGDTGMADSAAGGMSSHDTMMSMSGDSSVSGNTSVTAEGVLSQMNVANTTEIQLSTMAAGKARSPAVKQIARKLAADHSKNRQQVRALAQKLNVNLTPSAGGNLAAADSAALPADLQGKTGSDFDKAFVQHEIEDHQSNIEKIQSQILPSVPNDQVKSYLQKTVTEMQGHLSSLKQVQQQLGT